MFDSKIAYKVKSLLSSKRDQHFKIKDIARTIHIKKHKYKDLIDTLFTLAREEKIALKGRTYSYKGKDRNHSRKEIKENSKTVYNTGKSQHKILQGTFDSTSMARNKSYAFVITESVDVFVSAEDTLTAYHKDKVEIEVRYGRQGKQFGIITRIIKRAREQVVGLLQEYRGKFILIPDNSRIHTNFMINKINHAVSGQKVVLQVNNWGNRELQKLPALLPSNAHAKASYRLSEMNSMNVNSISS